MKLSWGFLVIFFFMLTMVITYNGEVLYRHKNFTLTSRFFIETITIECENGGLLLPDDLIDLPSNITEYFIKSPHKTIEIRNCQFLLTENAILNIKKNLPTNKTRAIHFESIESDLTRRQLLGLDIEELEFSNLMLNLSNDLIHDLPLRKFEIFESEYFTSIPDGFFKISTELNILGITRTRLIKIKQNDFSNLIKLKYLFLEGNENLNEIERDAFKNLVALYYLRLTRNNLSTLHGGTFKNLKDLEHLILHHCNLTNLPQDLFLGLESLQILDLSFNNLKSLPSFLFNFTAKIKTLDLSNNKLHTVERILFHFMDSIESIDLSNNQLSQLPSSLSVTRVSQLSVTRNNVKEINKYFCLAAKNLKKLDLSHNNLLSDIRSPLDVDFFDCEQLRHLDLSYNNISNFPLPIHEWSHRHRHERVIDLNLEYNDIREISMEFLMDFHGYYNLRISGDALTRINLTGYKDVYQPFNPERTTSTVDLSNFQLDCDCSYISIVKFLKRNPSNEIQLVDSNSVIKLSLANVTCKSPLSLTGRNLRDAQVEELFCENLKCPVNCSCLEYNEISEMDCSARKIADSDIDDLFWKSYSYESESGIKLNFTGNKLTKVPHLNETVFLKNTTHIDLSYNEINTVSLSFLLPHLQELKLHNNRIERIDDETISKLKNHEISKFTLHNNPWICDCPSSSFINFVIENSHRINNFTEITCNSNHSQVIHQSPFLLCYLGLIFSIITIIILIAIIGIIAALYYRHERKIKIWLYSKGWFLWFVSEEDLDEDKAYDAFISFSHKDEAFANEVVEKLEASPKRYQLCLHSRDWLAGEYIPNQIARSVGESRRTIIILSPNFIESVWAQCEFRMAYQQALNEKRIRVIVIMYEEVGNVDDLNLHDDIKVYLKMHTYIKWGDPNFWNKLMYAMPHNHQI